MNRVLVAAVVLEALVIAFLLLGRGPGPGPTELDAGSPRPREEPAFAGEPAVVPDGETSPPTTGRREGAPSAGVLLYGRLVDTDGNPVSGRGWITLLPEGGEAFSLRLGDGGGFVRAGLAPGRYTLRAQVRGYLPLEETLDVGEDVETLRKDLVLERALLFAVRFVTPDGESLTDAVRARAKEAGKSTFWLLDGLSAVATKGPPGPRLPLTMHRSWSRYGVGEYSPAGPFGIEPTKDDRHGTLDVKGGLPVYVSACLRSEVLATVRIDAPADRVEIVVDPDRVLGLSTGVTFRVETETGETPEHVFADLSDAQSGGSGEVEPDAEGRYTLDGRAPGEMQLTVGAADCERHYRVVVLPPGEILDVGTIRLGRAVRLPGRVLDADGKPVAGAGISWSDRDRAWDEQRGDPLSSRTDGEGRFSLPLGPRRYRIAVGVRDVVTWFADIDLTGEVPESFTIRLGPGAPLRIEFEADAAFPVRYHLLDGQGNVVAGGTRTGAWPITRRLAPGPYELITQPRNGPETRRRIELVGEETTTVRVR